MNMTDKLAKEIKKQITSSDDRKPKPYDAQAEVLRVEDGVAWVHIPGGVEETPVRLTINAKKGDMVNIHVANGSAWITGNGTNPPTDDSTANYAVDLSTNVQKDVVVLNTVVAEEIEATNARFTNVEADTAKIHDLTADQLTATVGYIEDLTADNVTAAKLTAAEGYISDLTADEITTNDIKAATGYIGDLTANNVTAQNVVADHGTIGSLDANYAKVNAANIDSVAIRNAWIDKILVQTDLLAYREQVYTLEAIQVNAANITAGTLDVNRLIVTVGEGSSAQKYLVNIDPSTGTPSYEKLDGNIVAPRTITADKIVANAITTNEITANNLVGTSGWINLHEGKFFYGNGADFATATNAISWNGSKLQIKADEFLLSSGKTIQEALEAIETWFYAVAPLPDAEHPNQSNAPANEWTTTKLKDLHLRDIYFDTTSGKSYRWAKEGSTYKWVEIEDVELAALAKDLHDNYPPRSEFTVAPDKIQSTVSAAQTAATNAANTATDNKLQNYSTTTQMNSAITQKANEITQSVSQTYQTKDAMSGYYTKSQTDSAITQKAGEISLSVAQTEIEKIEVGGRNLVSKCPGTEWATVTITDGTNRSIMLFGGSYGNLDIPNIPDVKAGDWVQVSFDIKFSSDWRATETGTKASSVQGNANVGGTWGGLSYSSGKKSELEAIMASSSREGHINARFKVTQQQLDGTYTGVAMSNIRFDYYSGTVSVRHVMVEKATTPSNWSPSPEDVEDYTDTQVSAAKAEIKVTTDEISSEVSKVSSVKYYEASGSGWTFNSIKTWSTEGYSDTWTLNTSNESIRIGDTIYLRAKDTTRDCYVYIKLTVTAKSGTTRITATSHGYEDVLPVETIKSTINQSSDSVKIQAKHVEIDGTATFNAIKSSVESTAQAAVDGIEVGGKNLLLQSNNGANYTWTQNGGATTKVIDSDGATFTITSLPASGSWGLFFIADDALKTKIVAGETYTLSYDFKTSDSISSLGMGFNIRQGNGANPYMHDNTAVVTTTANKWVHVTNTTTALDTLPSSSTSNLYISAAQLKEALRSFSIKNIKVEKGNKATDWTPAPEDIDASIDGIEVGGRNLLRHTKDLAGWTLSNSSTGASYQTVTLTDGEPTCIANFPNTSSGTIYEYINANGARFPYSFIRNKNVIFSAEVLATNDVTTGALFELGLYAAETGGSRLKYLNRRISINGTGKWERITLKLDITDSSFTVGTGTVDFNTCYIRLALFKVYDAGYTAGFQLRKLKLEIGTKATDWTPAPEDVQTEIDAKKSIHTINPSPAISQPYSWLMNVSADGYYRSAGWDVESTDGLEAGDTVRIKMSVSDMSNATVYLVTTVNSVSGNKLYATSHGIDTTVIDGGNILTNSIGANKIKVNEINIGAAQITSGTIDNARIPNLSADKITSGTINIGRIPADALNSNIAIGGRNIMASTTQKSMYKGTVTAYDKSYNGVTVTTTDKGGSLRFSHVIDESNIPYTISFVCTSSVATNVLIDAMDNTIQTFPIIAGTTKVVCTTIPTRAVDSTYHFIDVVFNAVGTFKLANIKIEKGNKATDWTPAPEDVQAEIDAKKSVHTLDTSYSYTYANILTYSAEGYGGTGGASWNVASSAGVKVGDTARLKVTVSNMSNTPVYIVGTVTAINSATQIKMTSHGLDTTIIDGGKILTNSITASQIAANAITADELAANAVTSDKIAAGAITVGKINPVVYSYPNNGNGIGYAKLCTISVTENYRNKPIQFTLHSRNKNATAVSWRFLNSNSPSTCTVASATYDGDTPLYYVGTGGTYTIYFALGESYDEVRIYDLIIPYTTGLTVTWDGAYYGTSLPSGAVVFTKLAGSRTSASIDDAATKATNYITNIDANGIWITPSGLKPTNTSTGAGATGTRINGSGMEVYKGGTSVAFYGDSARIGKLADSHVDIGANSITMQVKPSSSEALATAYEVKQVSTTVKTTRTYNVRTTLGNDYRDRIYFGRLISSGQKIILKYKINNGSVQTVTYNTFTVDVYSGSKFQFSCDEWSNNVKIQFGTGATAADTDVLTLVSIEFSFITGQQVVENAVGLYSNMNDTGVFRVGNGISSTSKSNAMLVGWDGTTKIGGDIIANCAADSSGGISLTKDMVDYNALYVSGSNYWFDGVVHRVGNVVTLDISANRNTSIASGKDLFSISLSSHHVPVPLSSSVTGMSYYGAHAIGILMEYDAGAYKLIVRNASTSAVTVSNVLKASLTYVCETDVYTDS